MAGELKEWNDAVPIGETHEFTFELFKNLEDTNVKFLIGIMKQVDDAYESIRNLNGIKDEDET